MNENNWELSYYDKNENGTYTIVRCKLCKKEGLDYTGVKGHWMIECHEKWHEKDKKNAFTPASEIDKVFTATAKEQADRNSA